MKGWYEHHWSREQLGLVHMTYKAEFKQQGECRILLSMHYDRRPARQPENNSLYDCWYKELGPVSKRLEDILTTRGYYKYEGAKTMFDVKSADGRQLHVDDIVSTPDCPEGIIMSIIAADKVQINPTGKGLPIIVLPGTITIISSFIEKLNALATDEELMAILQNAEGLAGKIGAPRERTASTTSGPRKAKVEAVEDDDL